MGRIHLQKTLVVIGGFYLIGAGVLIFLERGTLAQIQSTQASSYTAIAPQLNKLRIPRIDVDARIQTTGLTASGDIGIPTNYTNVAWFNGSARPGERGNAVMVGHRDTRIFAPGVFRNLNQLNVGDDVFIENAAGETLHFRVVDKKIYYEDTDRLAEIVGLTDRIRLNLITCEGNWNQSVKRYDQRLVVFTELAQ